MSYFDSYYIKINYKKRKYFIVPINIIGSKHCFNNIVNFVSECLFIDSTIGSLHLLFGFNLLTFLIHYSTAGPTGWSIWEPKMLLANEFGARVARNFPTEGGGAPTIVAVHVYHNAYVLPPLR